MTFPDIPDCPSASVGLGAASPDRSRILRRQFLTGMAHAASAVSVVTTDGTAGRAGVTVSAMTSVSADMEKPTLLVCIHHLSPAASRILENGAFCVNILRTDQFYVSDTFAGRLKPHSGDKFDCAGWTTMRTGSPRILDPLAAFDCTVIQDDRVGTHHIFVGEVEDVFTEAAGSPLIYSQRTYGRTTAIDTAESTRDGAGQRESSLRIGCFHTFGPVVVPDLIARMRSGPEMGLALVEGDQIRILQALGSGEIDIALVYGFEISDTFFVEHLASLAPYVLLARNSPLARHPSLSLAQLAREPMILLEAPPSSEYFLSLFTGVGLNPNIRFRLASLEMVRGLVGHGFGYSLLSTRPASDMTYDGRELATRPLIDEVAGSPVVLVRRRHDQLESRADEFARQCRKYFARFE